MQQEKLLCKENEPKIKRSLTLYETYDKLIVHIAQNQGLSVSKFIRNILVDLVHYTMEEKPEIFNSITNKKQDNNNTKKEEIVINV